MWCWMMLDVFDGFWWRCFWFGLLYLCCSETVQKGSHLSFHKLYCTFKYSIQPNSILYSHLWAFTISQATNLNTDFRVDTPTKLTWKLWGWARSTFHFIQQKLVSRTESQPLTGMERNGKRITHISQVLGTKWHYTLLQWYLPMEHTGFWVCCEGSLKMPVPKAGMIEQCV